MSDPDRASARRAGALGTVGGGLTAASGLLVVAVLQPTTDVPDDRWSYPWSSTALVPVSVAYAVLHLLVLVGLVGFLRTGVAGEGRSTRAGAALALTGLVLFTAAELASIPVRAQQLDDTGAVVVGSLFGAATVLTAVGMIVLGMDTLRARSWHGWRRTVPLATGIWLLVVAALAVTPALAAGVAVYGLLAAALGIAVVTEPGPSPVPARSGPATVQV
jgi:hypothetical protein